MSKQVIKGWMDGAGSIPQLVWSVADNRVEITLENIKFPEIWKYKGTTQDAIDFKYTWPPKRVTITIEIKE